MLTAFLFYLIQRLCLYFLQVNFGLFLDVSLARSTMCLFAIPPGTEQSSLISFHQCQKLGLRLPAGPESTLVRRLRKSAQDLNCRCLQFDKDCGTDSWPHQGARDHCFQSSPANQVDRFVRVVKAICKDVAASPLFLIAQRDWRNTVTPLIP